MNEPLTAVPPEVPWQETLKSQQSIRSATSTAARRNFTDIFPYYFQKFVPMTIVGTGERYVYSNLPPITHEDPWNNYLESFGNLNKIQNFLRGSAKGREKVVRLHEGTLQSTHLVNSSQHAIVALSVLNRYTNWEEILKAISEMSRVIAPGGRFIHLLDMRVNPPLLAGIDNSEQLPAHELFGRGLVEQFNEHGFNSNTRYFDNTAVVYPGRPHKQYEVKGKPATLFSNNVGDFNYFRGAFQAANSPQVIERSRMQVFETIKIR